MKQRHSILSMKRIQTVVEICAWKYYVEGEILIRGIQWTSYFFLLFIFWGIIRRGKPAKNILFIQKILVMILLLNI